MFPDCTFYLSKATEIYESGELVEGFINLYLSDPIQVKDIQIALHGHGYVSWNENGEKCNRDASGAVTEIIEFKSSEHYAQVRRELAYECYLAAGTHNMPFSLRLPENCPGSFEGTLGSIRYYLAVTFVTMSRIKEKFKYDIIVEKREDLNLHPEYKLPVQVEEIKKFSWITCTDGRIHYTLTTPIGAYAPLQRLHYILKVENQSMNNVTGYETSIIQQITYTAKIPVLKKHVVSDVVFNREFDDECLRLTTRLFEHYIQIPPLPPSNTDGGNNCALVCIEYELRVTVFISGCTQDTIICMPLHICSTALVESLHAAILDDAANSSPSAPILPVTSSDTDSPPSYHNIEPPSFTEAITKSEPPSFDSVANCSSPSSR